MIVGEDKRSRKTLLGSDEEFPILLIRLSIVTNESWGIPQQRSNRGKNISGAASAACFATIDVFALDREIHYCKGIRRTK